MICYRFSRDKTLPLHWCYSDPWEQEYDEYTDEIEWIDLRGEGAQVWTSLESVVACILGRDRDGRYPPSEYPWLLIIEAVDLVDSCGEWSAVLSDDVISVRAISTTEIIHKLSTLRSPETWIARNEQEFASWLMSHSTPIPPVFVETLPRPDGED
jgi:hypothetical protein